MVIQKQLNSYKDSFTRVKLIKNLLGKTCLFLLMSYILFHFINDNYGFSRIEKLQYSLNTMVANPLFRQHSREMQII